jgi:hypothetical protein
MACLRHSLTELKDDTGHISSDIDKTGQSDPYQSDLMGQVYPQPGVRCVFHFAQKDGAG